MNNAYPVLTETLGWIVDESREEGKRNYKQVPGSSASSITCYVNSSFPHTGLWGFA
jgi:hypothetical protein